MKTMKMKGGGILYSLKTWLKQFLVSMCVVMYICADPSKVNLCPCVLSMTRARARASTSCFSVAVMYLHPRKLPGNEDRRFKERQYENALQDKINFMHKYKNLMRYAQFESSNEPRTSFRDLAEKLEAIRSHRNEVLHEKRRRLSFILGDEESTLNHEIRTGSMNLAERRAWLKARAMSASAEKLQKNPNSLGETKLEKSIQEAADDMSMHNSKVAVVKAEVEKKRQRQNERNMNQKDRNLYNLLECEDSQDQAYDEHGVDILRRHLHMVDHLREEEKMAVEEDLISMNQRWLEEYEALRRQHVELRNYHSLQVKDYLQ